MKKTPLLFFFLFLISSQSKAQSWVAVSISQNSCICDLTPSVGNALNFSNLNGQLGYSLSYERAFDSQVSLFIDLGLASYESELSLSSTVDPFEVAQNPNFIQFVEGSFMSASMGFNWTYWELGFMDLYTSVGLGFSRFSLTDLEGRELRDVPETRANNEEYSEIFTFLPLKMGALLFSKSKLSISFEFSWLITNTDYLDNIGQFGNPTSDGIFRNSITLRYKLFN